MRTRPEVLEHYERDYTEADRLGAGGTPGLELLRTQDVLRRYAPPAPARVLDVGGGPGVYAEWLAGLGYQVRLIDPVERHVAQARARGVPADLGDARALPEPDSAADLVLLLGPLYHLTERADRVTALAEAARVVRPGGVVIAAAISRFASMHDGLNRGFLADPEFVAIVDGALRDGQHRNPGRRPHWFTTAYFHLAGELAGEVAAADLTVSGVLGVEGAAGLLADLPAILADPTRRAQLLDLLRRTEAEPSLLGVSGHLLAVARRA